MLGYIGCIGVLMFLRFDDFVYLCVLGFGVLVELIGVWVYGCVGEFGCIGVLVYLVYWLCRSRVL